MQKIPPSVPPSIEDQDQQIKFESKTTITTDQQTGNRPKTTTTTDHECNTNANINNQNGSKQGLDVQQQQQQHCTEHKVYQKKKKERVLHKQQHVVHNDNNSNSNLSVSPGAVVNKLETWPELLALLKDSVKIEDNQHPPILLWKMQSKYDINTEIIYWNTWFQHRRAFIPDVSTSSQYDKLIGRRFTYL